jgi:NTP pyrophosphatase (non-canonical NTP hydrolase)
MNSFTELQAMTNLWREHNFPHHTADDQFYGMVEEMGELAHANLKLKQNIRTDEDHAEKEMDAIGDFIIYLCGYCTRRELSLAECITRAWNEVKDRDWIAYPGTGRPPKDALGGIPPGEPPAADLGSTELGLPSRQFGE